jgi:diadenylate cyclase
VEGFFKNIDYIRMFSWVDALDILIVALLIYQVLKFAHGTSVESILKGILVVIVMYFVSDIAHLSVIHYVLQTTSTVALFAVLIMFQPELRRIMETLGRSRRLSAFLKRDDNEPDVRVMIREVVDACSSMSWSRTGALIVFEREKPLGEVLTAATQLDAKTTSELVKNIFFVKAPLHDGAMIISGTRIAAAGCVLPLSENEELPPELGTRHRAGIGITEKTDAVSVIVSEETGVISVAVAGALRRNLSPEALENVLIHEIIEVLDKTEVIKKTQNLFVPRKGKSK